MEQIELKPCPFCGHGASMTQVASASGGERQIWVVGCNNEDCEVSFHGHARQVDAANAWNRRLSPWHPILSSDDLPEDAGAGHLFQDEWENWQVRSYVSISECVAGGEGGGFIAWQTIEPYTTEGE